MPNYYNPYMFPQNYVPVQPVQNVQPVSQPQGANPQPQIQGSFMPAPNEDFARNYPVGVGNSVTFKDENAPYIYTKTMGFSQMDAPKFERYKLVKEDAVERSNSAQNESIDIKSVIDSIDKINDEIEAIWADIDGIKDAKPKNTGRTGSGKRDKDGDDRYDE